MFGLIQVMSILVLLCGASASGKSIVAEKIGNRMKDITSISMDNFYRGLTSEEKENVEEYNFDDPNAIDMDLFVDCIQKLKSGNKVNIPIYDFRTHSRTNDTIQINPSKIIIVEGIFSLYNEFLRGMADIKVYIDATPETRLFRRINRDVSDRGRDINSVEIQYKKFVLPAYEKYIQPYKIHADLVIPNNDNNKFIGTNLLCDLLEYKLKNLNNTI